MNAEHPSPVETTAFPSFESLRQAHNELLKLYREAGPQAETIATVKAFIQRGSQAGALIDADDERQAAQSILDYWATRLYRLDDVVPDSTLAEFDPHLAPDLADELCPYLGLDAFDEAQGNLLFGRRKLIEALMTHLQSNRLLVVTGPSGSGKSSLVRGGLIPTLKSAEPEGYHAHYFPPILPGSDPLRNLSQLLTTPSPELQETSHAEALRKNPRHLAQWVDRFMNGDAVIIVDQFEEVFTLCDDPAIRQAFVDNLVNLVQDDGHQHRVILTIRTDFESQVARLPDFQPLFDAALVRVTPLNAAELREAIENPAKLIGLKFEDGVVDALLNDILGEPAALPLLQFTLLKLWEHRDHNRVTWETYRRLGGGRMALARSADEFYNALIPEEQVTARRIFLRLVRPGEGLEVTSYRMRRASLYHKAEAADRIDRVLEKCLQARLLRQTRGATPADDQIEVAHEALVRNWPTLIGWLEEERLLLRDRQRLTVAAERWRSMNQDPSTLLRGALLREAQHYDDLNELETAFIQASQVALEAEEAAKEAARQRELEDARQIAEQTEARRRAEEGRAREAELAAKVLRRRNRIITTVGSLALLLAVVSVFLFTQATNAQRQAQTQEAIAVAQRATAIAESHLRATAQIQAEVQQGYAEAASTLAVAQRGTAEAASTLAVAQQKTAEANRAQAIAQQMTAEAASTEALYQSQLAATQEALARQQSQLATSRQLAALASTYLVTRPDLSLLLSVEAYRAATTHEALSMLLASLQRSLRRTSVEESFPLFGLSTAITSMAFTPDWSILAMGNQDGSIILRDIQGQIVLNSPGYRHSEAIHSLVYSPDGTHMASGGADGLAYIYNISENSTFAPVANEEDVWSVAFSPDGSTLAIGRASGLVTLWGVESWDEQHIKELHDYLLHAGIVYSLAWSPDGQKLASGGTDRLVRVWSAETGQTIFNLEGHSRKIRSLAWSPNGQYIASGSDDNTIILWDAINGRMIGSPLSAHQGAVTSVAFSPDSQLLVSGSTDRTIILWDVATLKPIDLLKETLSVNQLAFSPDGKMLASNTGNVVNLWKITSQQPLGQFIFGQAGNVEGVIVRPEGDIWALVGSNSPALWDLSDAEKIEDLRGANYTDLWLNPYDDGKTLITCDAARNIQVWDTQSGEKIYGLETKSPDVIEAAVLNPGGNILAWGVCTTRGKGGLCTSSAIQLWDVVHDRPLGEAWPNERGDTLGLAFNHDSTQMASANSDGSIVLWNVASGQPLGLPLIGRSSLPTRAASVAFSPNGEFLASSSAAGTIVLWDLAARQEIGDPFSAIGVSSLAFSQAGAPLLAAGFSDGSVILWDVDAASWLVRACQAVQRNFSQAEWAQFFPDQPYHKTCDPWPAGE